KGVLVSACPGAVLVDLTHAIQPGDIPSAAYVLERTWPRYPAGSVHLVVVDPGVGSERAALAIRAGGHVFIGPDNGVLTHPLGAGSEAIRRLEVPPGASPTFHARDVFAPATARAASGIPVEELGREFTGTPVTLSVAEPHHEGKALIGTVVYSDRFGNLVTNLDRNLVPSYGVLEVEGVEIGPLLRTFGDVPPGELLAYVGSGGQVEIAVRGGSAARRLGLGVGGRVKVRLG
ncbi:MAG: SAM hydrolase/SAM-dependent halogenase family protein, partial [Gemmatimonadales bacterium]